MSASARWALRAASLACALITGILVPAGSAAAAVTTNQIAVPRPPMGWASWNSFAAVIDAPTIKAQVDAFVASGLPAAGYRYVNIDEGWWQGARDGAGNIAVDAAQWPGGMAAIVSYIHSKGLLAGIYTDAGKNGCGFFFPTGRPAAPNTGSEGHYLQDMIQFETWGFDFVKVDWCGGDAEGLDPQTTFQAISAALASATATTGHPMTLSICEWGRQNPWNWGAGLGAMWRASTDIIFFGQSASLPPVLSNFDQAQHPVSQHTGYANDPDMLTVGMPGLSAAQGRTEMSLWAISGAPLLAGNNLATMSATTAAILKNGEVIAIDQDPRGLQAVKVAEDSAGLQVYGKVLSGSGRRAVVLLNRTSAAATMTVRWADLGLTTAAATVRNVWAATTLGGLSSFSTSVPANDSVLLTITGTEAGAATYEAESAANTRTGSATVVACPACSGGSKIGSIGNGSANTLRFNGIAASDTELAVATIAYANGDTVTRTATLTTNGQAPTTVAFPPTGSWTTPGTVSVIVSLRAGSANAITFANASSGGPDLDAIAISPLPGTRGSSVVGGQSGRCLDVNNNTITNGTPTQLWDCTGGPNQTWVYTARKQLVVFGNKCLDANNNGTTNGTAVIIWDCNGQTNQQWNVNANGTITGVQSGLCLDANGRGTANGTSIILWACSGATNQLWTPD